MDKTANYQLSQWEKTDRIQMEDFNADNAKIDAALGVAAGYGATLAQHTAALSKLGNCRIYTASYTGSGQAGSSSPNSLYLPKKPLVVLIFGGGGWFLANLDSASAWSFPSVSGGYANTCYFSGGAFRWYSTSSPSTQMNVAGTHYYMVALVDAAQ